MTLIWQDDHLTAGTLAACVLGTSPVKYKTLYVSKVYDIIHIEDNNSPYMTYLLPLFRMAPLLGERIAGSRKKRTGF